MADFDKFLDTLAAQPGRIELYNAVQKAQSNDKTMLLLTCIDLRYPDVIHSRMEPKFHKLYDHVCLAGAGLAPVVDFGADRKPHWEQTFLEHVAVSIALHSISKVIVMDHRDCGAYRKFGLLTKDDNGTAKEKTVHFQQMKRLKTLLKKEFPQLEFYGILLPIEPEHDKATGKATGKLKIETLN
jgi:carbonic anhydrase